jgi:hypothetical protein
MSMHNGSRSFARHQPARLEDILNLGCRSGYLAIGDEVGNIDVLVEKSVVIMIIQICHTIKKKLGKT